MSSSHSLTNLEKVHKYFHDFESPSHFIDWNFLYAISSCLGRRVYFQNLEMGLFPNIYVVIVGPPGVGKSLPAKRLSAIISSMVTLDTNGKPKDLVNIVPQCLTLERLYEVLERCGDAIKTDTLDENGKRKAYFHSSASFLLADEMGLLFKKNDKIKDLTQFLNAGFDCIEKFKYETKKNGVNVITNLCVNFFGCTTPAWISENIGSGLIDDGFASRVFWVWGEEKRKQTTFYRFTKEQEQCLLELKEHFRKLATLTGEVNFTPEAAEYFHDWYQRREKSSRVNKDSKLDGYYARKKVATLKMCMLFHFMENVNNVITLETLKKTFAFLAETEIDMHKALASVNANPTARLAEDIKRDLKSTGGMNKAEILVKHFSKGGISAIGEAIQYLELTQQITGSMGGAYKLTKKIIDEIDFKAASNKFSEEEEVPLKKVGSL
jgi:hypothetical protein